MSCNKQRLLPMSPNDSFVDLFIFIIDHRKIFTQGQKMDEIKITDIARALNRLQLAVGDRHDHISIDEFMEMAEEAAPSTIGDRNPTCVQL